MGATLSELNITCNGYDQCNDSDINDARLTYSVVTLLLVPFQIGINLVTILAIYFFERLHTIPNVLVANSAVNGLLAGFILNPTLAILFLPDHILHVDKSNIYVCISFFLPYYLFGLCSCINQTMITTERFLSIIYPIRYRKVKSVKRVRRIMICSWIFCIILALLPYIWNNHTAGQCHAHTTLSRYHMYIVLAISVGCIVSSFVLNVIVVNKAFKYNKHFTKGVSEENIKLDKNRRRQARLSAFLYIAYLIGWVPFFIAIPARQFHNSKAIEIFHTAAVALAVLHFSLTTLVHLIVKKHLRRAIKLLLTTAPWRWSRLRGNRLDAAATVIQSSNTLARETSGNKVDETSTGDTSRTTCIWSQWNIQDIETSVDNDASISRNIITRYNSIDASSIGTDTPKGTRASSEIGTARNDDCDIYNDI